MRFHNKLAFFQPNGFQVGRDAIQVGRDGVEKPAKRPKLGSKARAQRFSNPQAIQRVRRKFFALHAATRPANGEEAPKTQQIHDVIDHVMMLHHLIMQNGETLNRRTRLQLMIIFFQGALAIVFNVYNLVMYFLKIAHDMDVQLSLPLTLLFYVYLISCAAFEILITVVGFSMVYGSISGMVREVNHLLLYVQDDWSRNRLSQFTTMITTSLRKYTLFYMYTLDGTFISAIISGTTTYIIILVQYSDSPEGVGWRNQTTSQ